MTVEADSGEDEERELAEARQQLMELARIMGRAAARAAHKRGLHFDLNDPQVQKDMMHATFDALFLSRHASR